MNKYSIKTDNWIVLSLLVILIYMSPFMILGKNIHEPIFDNLDSNIIIYKLLVESGKIFAPANSIIPNAMNGLPRISFGSEFNVTVLLNYLFSPFMAIFLNYLIMRFVAFFSLLIFLKRWIIKSDKSNIVIAVSLTYALLPYIGTCGITIPVLPLVLHIFLKIRNHEDNWKDWLLLAVIPFYTSFVFCYVFFIAFLFIYFIYDSINQKKINFRFLTSMIFMTSIYLIIEYRLVLGMLLHTTNFISHRTTWNPDFFGNKSLLGAIKRGFNIFSHDVYFAKTCHFYIFITSIIALVMMMVKKFSDRLLISLLYFNFITSILMGLHSWSGLNFLRSKYNILLTFNITRFYTLWPLTWYIIFAISLKIIYSKVKFGKYIVYFFIIIQIFSLFYSSNEVSMTINKLPSFKEYYSTSLFKKIDKYIGKDKSTYNVLTIGIQPAVPLYNGFHTLGGYFMTYPLKYKLKFRKIFEKELEKNPKNKFWFDGWGSRCYLQPAEIPREDKIYSKNSKLKLKNLQLNTEVIKSLNGRYIFSAVEIVNYRENHLKFLKSFTNNESPWKIYLYKVL